ncbi:hypothetical protein JR316_0001278 [Psilocybe cubensis]|uniref:Uncharacterized protein n=1 Tax=Psilocybe cubensis TaxID=181762 RepID=A0ACB8HH92_PSICU|nr:hypothetical protein JR316_0001278 [Psilocybe cubensis]KAH9487209.1 hypothetical protein JR316_0001278 [Psilocybe cubensis]
MYFFWWHKPMDIQRRLPVFLKPGSDYVRKIELKRAIVMEDPEIALRDIEEALAEENTRSAEGDGVPPGTGESSSLRDMMY